MVDYLDSPVPYVIGVNETVWNKIVLQKWGEVSDDTVAFFLDTGLMMTKLDLLPGPEPMTSLFHQTLNDIYLKSESMNERELKAYLK